MNYVLIGVGYVAPKHLTAIKATGGTLIAALDKHDSVGILDRYFPECEFFTEFERFDRHCEKIKEQIDYVVVCSPNYLHDAHIRFGLRIGAKVICEKPAVLNPWNVDELIKMGGEVNCILQLRLHPEIQNLTVERPASGRLIYHTPRGKWYNQSWKGSVEKSGGICTNIGIHLFDLLLYKFGAWSAFQGETTKDESRGILHFPHLPISWDLSIKGIPERKLIIGDRVFDFTKGFDDLHTLSYQRILEGKGFTLEDARPAIELVSKLRD